MAASHASNGLCVRPTITFAMTITAPDFSTLSATLGLKQKSNGDLMGFVEDLLSGGLK